MIKEIKKFGRAELFNHYNKCDNPFVFLTTKIDVTNVVNYCKKHKNFYPTLGYLITKTVNSIDAFKYRYRDGKFYYCDEVKSNYTQMFDNNNIGYFNVSFSNDYSTYIQNFLNTQKKFLEDNNYSDDNDLDEIWLSCAPWFSFTGLITPYNKDVLIPQFVWDKYECINDKYYVNLMIMVHHGFADGFHIGKFINELQKNINLFN